MFDGINLVYLIGAFTIGFLVNGAINLITRSL